MVEYFNNITFEDPGWFWLFLLIPFLVIWYILKRHKQTAAVTISSLKGFKVKQGLLPRLKPVLFVLQMIGLVLLITAMAQPRKVEVTRTTDSKQGIDIVMAMDISGSMLAKDLKPDRLQALKSVAKKFVKGRPNDRIGLVIYAGESYTKTPVTSDKRIVMNALNDLEYDRDIEDGTAIGMGLSTAVNRLKDSKAESKVVILLTDGVNNTGYIDPETAAELAESYAIKVYTIGIGSNGTALTPVGIKPNGEFHYERVPVKIDDDLMKDIAQKTGGQYFRATDKNKLEQIYDEIDKMEKTDLEEHVYHSYTEKFRPLVILAGIIFLMEFLLRYTVFRSFV